MLNISSGPDLSSVLLFHHILVSEVSATPRPQLSHTCRSHSPLMSQSYASCLLWGNHGIQGWPKSHEGVCWGSSGDIILTLKKETQGFLTFFPLDYAMSEVWCLGCAAWGGEASVLVERCHQGSRLSSLCSSSSTCWFLPSSKLAVAVPVITFQVQRQPGEQRDCPFPWPLGVQEAFP